MKKISLLFLTAIISVASLCAVVFSACGDDNNGNNQNTDNNTKYDYSVTVLDEDEVTGVAGVTVKWSQANSEAASAVTDANGKATSSIAGASYNVTLLNLPEGMTYTPATVTATARGITIVLEKSQVNYTATVKKSDSSPAAGVTVTWSANGTVAGTATTDDNGHAEKTLVYGNYTVTISDLPEGSVYVGSKQVTGAAPAAEFLLTAGQTTEYTVTVKSEGGLLFKDYALSAFIKDGDEAVANAVTDEEGKAKFSLSPDYTYEVYLQKLPEGYDEAYATLDKDNVSVNLILHSEVITTHQSDASKQYLVGDIIHDYEFVTPYEVEGKNLTYTFADLLNNQHKKAILLNFWGTNCSACMQEMPAMQQAYEIYSDDIEIIAVSNYMGGDSNSKIEAFRSDNNYTFPMFRDTHSFTSRFALSAWPTNVIIDRYGAIARIEEGALTSLSMWEKLLDQYVASDYTQTFVPGTERNDSTFIEMAKPDIKVDDEHYVQVGQAINSVNSFTDGCSVTWFGEPEETAEFTWPFILKELDGQTILYPSNTNHDNTFSFIYADIEMPAGKAVTFDYWLQTEENNDRFYVFFDGKPVYTMSGENESWKTCYVYSDLIAGKHQLALCYYKDISRSAGFDSVYIKNLRFADLSELTEPIDMLRGAAYGAPEEGAKSFLYYAPVEKKDDGYYHVKLDSLTGADYAGNDPSPMLLANFDTATNWSKNSITEFIYAIDEETGEYFIDCTFELNGVKDDWRELLQSYANLASKSDIKGYIPVDEALKQLLTAFVKHISGDSYADEWLELCYFYSHYGSGSPKGNPIIGLTEDTAIEVNEGTHTADLTRLIMPYPVTIYSFTPQRSGIFTIESLIPEKLGDIYAGQIWIYDDNSSMDEPIYYSGNDRFYRTAENEYNFVSNVYLTQGHKYYLALALLMSERGTFDFRIQYSGQSIEILDTCTSSDYQIVDNHLELRYAVEYAKDEDGYYHVLNSDGSLGSFIYVDFKYPSFGNINSPLSQVINQYIVDPLDYTKKLYKVFDYTQTIAYVTTGGTEDNPVYDYAVCNPAIYDEENAADYIDYTDIMQAYCEKALSNTGKEEGFLKATDELVKILTMYHFLRTDSIVNGVKPYVIENEWLRFCWYYRTVDAENPV